MQADNGSPTHRKEWRKREKALTLQWTQTGDGLKLNDDDYDRTDKNENNNTGERNIIKLILLSYI